MKIMFYQLQYVVTENERDKILNQEIAVESLTARKLLGRITKSVPDMPIPRIGESVSDSYWPRDFTEQKVVDVCYDLIDDCCYVYLKPFFVVENSAQHLDLNRIAELHGWEFKGM